MSKLSKEDVERRRKLGLVKAIEMAKKYAGVTGVAYIRDEKGKERWLPKIAYLMMLDAGRKVTLLEERLNVREVKKKMSVGEKEIRKILESEGWKRTVGAPENVIDYQRSKPYNRIIIYPSDLRYLRISDLRKLMSETDLSKHAEILLEAWKTIKTIEEKPEVIETKVPEGVETVKYTFVNEKDAELVETMFDAITTGKYEFRSAVNIGTMVRCVMYEKGEKVGTPVRVIVTDKDMAWHLQQLIDWCLRKQVKVLAIRREGKNVEVAFRMEGIAPPPPKEKLWYSFKKTDGWSLVGEEK